MTGDYDGYSDYKEYQRRDETDLDGNSYGPKTVNASTIITVSSDNGPQVRYKS